MKTTKQLSMAIPIILFLLSTVQAAVGAERKSLSDDYPFDSPSVQSLLKLPSWVKRELLGQHKTEATKKPSRHFTGGDILRLNRDRIREYSRHGSWAPLETKPGEESFHLFTF
ncbi:MAG: hypothetical protein NPIRA05_15590 [Nitrospirales bacterium]|nr:MAG: hypothetical protein NPIRA05_15590 [Nitrospirales bacterium]